MTTTATIPGSGSRFATDMWLYARDMFSLSFPRSSQPNLQPMTISINEFDKYFSSSANSIKLEQGMHTTLRIKQVEHVATSTFKNEDLGTRQCRFPYENPSK